MSPEARRCAPGSDAGTAAHRGFTLVELLIVIAVIGLLIAAIAVAGTKLIHHQRARYTEAIMKNLGTAIDQFAEANPLRGIYDRKDAKTFGPYPAFPPAGSSTLNTVRGTLEPDRMGQVPPEDVRTRLLLDLDPDGPGGPRQAALSLVQDNDNDDIRALCTYLKVFTPGALGQVPEDRVKPLPDRTPAMPAEMVNASGGGTATPGAAGVIDVVGVYDAWDVPLDYLLYVKLALEPMPGGQAGQRWVIADRRPVLRSRGIRREVYDQWRQEPDGTPPFDTSGDWMFSEAFPVPAADSTNQSFWRTGQMPQPQPGAATAAGWARIPGVGDLYVDGATKDERAFGYVP